MIWLGSGTRSLGSHGKSLPTAMAARVPPVAARVRFSRSWRDYLEETKDAGGILPSLTGVSTRRNLHA